MGEGQPICAIPNELGKHREPACWETGYTAVSSSSNSSKNPDYFESILARVNKDLKNERPFPLIALLSRGVGPRVAQALEPVVATGAKIAGQTKGPGAAAVLAITLGAAVVVWGVTYILWPDRENPDLPDGETQDPKNSLLDGLKKGWKHLWSQRKVLENANPEDPRIPAFEQKLTRFGGTTARVTVTAYPLIWDEKEEELKKKSEDSIPLFYAFDDMKMRMSLVEELVSLARKNGKEAWLKKEFEFIMDLFQQRLKHPTKAFSQADPVKAMLALILSVRKSALPDELTGVYSFASSMGSALEKILNKTGGDHQQALLKFLEQNESLLSPAEKMVIKQALKK